MDSTSISDQQSFLNRNLLHEYLIEKYRENDFQFDINPFIDFDINLTRIHVEQFTWQDCIEIFKSERFIQQHSIEDNQQMINYFYNKSSQIPRSILEQIPFLMDQHEHLQLCSNIYFPSNDTTCLHVHKNIFNWLNNTEQQEIKAWLESLGIIERTDLIYLQKTILANVSTYITKENAIKTIRMLFSLFQKDKITRKDFKELKQLKLLTTQGNLVSAHQCYFSDLYNPRLKLEDYLKTKQDQFLTCDYPKNDQDLIDWRQFFGMIGVHEDLQLIDFHGKMNETEAIENNFSDKYLSEIRWSCKIKTVNAYSNFQTIRFLHHTENNYEFANVFWSYVFQNIKSDRLNEQIKIYYTSSDEKIDKYGKMIDFDNYISWFVNNHRCIPTTNNTCELANKIFADTNELKELCGPYMQFLSINTYSSKITIHWQEKLHFKTKLSACDYLDLFERIRHNSIDSNNNLHRLQLIYANILDKIGSWSREDQIAINRRKNQIFLLTENKQWKLVDSLFLYMEDNASNKTFGDTIHCLKFDSKNRQHRNVKKFLDLFGIKPLRTEDLKLVHENTHHATQFSKRLIEILPYLQKWLLKSSFSSEIVSSIEQILQNSDTFFESNYLKLFYGNKIVDETHVYLDILHNKLYVTHPWNSEFVLMTLSKKLCQLLNIDGFEKELNFLLRAQKEDIDIQMKKLSIEVLSSIKSEMSSNVSQNWTQQSKPMQKSFPNVSATTNLNIEIFDTIILTDISSITTSVTYPSVKNAQSTDLELLTGRQGEYIVYNYLCNKYRHQENSILIKWENEYKESQLSYDILLIENGKENYIEVKSTRQFRQHSFPLSFQQIETILQNPDNYFIYRVYIDERKLLILDRISSRLKTKQHLSCFLTID